ncbi:hypothetical protein OH799_05420 [Nocardia sp. NBC_00881]|uniref:IS3 family transposase n=1 Tax=Nocardia sp. NBC_00881 TaxID=2975995 RepID=UPI00386E6A1B|nr:hypothetical protein OH799_05420 [Nocardia sp. NBC_00881]
MRAAAVELLHLRSLYHDIDKHEHYYRHAYAMTTEHSAAVGNWIHRNNHRRRHSAIGMRSPIDYEHSLNAAPEAG